MKRLSRRGWGTLRLRGKRWHAAYTDQYGNRKAVGSFDNKADAEFQLQQIKYWLDTGNYEMISNKKLCEKQKIVFDTFVQKELETREISYKTRENYISLYKRHIYPVFGHKRLIQITEEDCLKWYRNLDQNKSSLLRKGLQLMKLVFNSALRQKIIVESPAKNLKTKKSKITAAAIYDVLLDQSQIRTLIESMDPEARLAVVLGVYCGTRISEALAIKEEDVNLEKKYVRINKQVRKRNGEFFEIPPKTESSNRAVPIPKEAIPYFKDHLENYYKDTPNHYLFKDKQGNPFLRSSFTRRYFFSARNKAGLVGYRYHNLRHNCLTFYGQKGANIRELMAIGGHTKPDIAIIYQETSNQRLQDLADRISFSE
jgi:integrase